MYQLHTSNQVDVWLFSLESTVYSLPELKKILSIAEIQKAAKFHFEADQTRYVISHGVLRQILAKYIMCSPNEISYSLNAYGKPELAYPHEPTIHFNLSHSHQLGALAIAMHPVGIDIEQLQPLEDYLALAKHFLSLRELHDFQNFAPSEKQFAFFRAWTQKEAYIKAIGMGLSYPIDQVTLTLKGDPQIVEDLADPQNEEKWSLYMFQHQDYLGAVTSHKNAIINQYWVNF